MTQLSRQVMIEGVDAQTIFEKFDNLERTFKEYNIRRLKSDNQEVILTREDVAKKLQISLPTLNSWTKKGVLRAYRVGNTVRYKETEIMIALKPMPNDSDRNTKTS